MTGGRSSMSAAIAALENCADDLDFFSEHPELGPGLALLVAARIRRLSDEMAEFGARDLLVRGES